jgi:hypothetical protein
MRITRRNRGWLVGAAAVAGLLMALVFLSPRPRSGAGLLLGVLSSVLIAVCASRGLRRRLQPVRFGAASFWLKAHVWLGVLSLIFALAHGGFRLGGPLSTALTLVLFFAVLSGGLGLVLQRVLTRQIHALSSETIFDLNRGAMSLRRRIYESVWAACGAPPEVPGEVEAIRQQLRASPRVPDVILPAGSLAGQEELARFYRDLVLPFLRAAGGGSSPLAIAADATLAFDALDSRLAPQLRPYLGELRERCKRLRTARRQHQLHRLLHSWLLLHVPLSMALIILLIAHAAMALRY